MPNQLGNEVSMSDLPPGTTQAQAMIRRVSPEGRALAERERRRRRQRANKMARRYAGVAVVIVAILVVIGLAGIPLSPSALGFAGLIFVIACALIAYAWRPRPASAAILDATPVAALPGATAAWLDARRAALPTSATALLDGIDRRLEALAPQLAALDPQEPAADAVRRLLAVELPRLIGRYEAVPATLRAAERDGRASADAHLMNGLVVVDREIARVTDELARGDFDALATQDRFLALKYDADDMLAD